MNEFYLGMKKNNREEDGGKELGVCGSL